MLESVQSMSKLDCRFACWATEPRSRRLLAVGFGSRSSNAFSALLVEWKLLSDFDSHISGGHGIEEGPLLERTQ